MNAPFNHPTYRGLMASILADPGEDTHRLALADWLDEEGYEARANFTRTQVELGVRHPCEFSKIDTCFDRREDATEVGWSGCKLCRKRVAHVKKLKAREQALWDGAVGDNSIFSTWFDAPDEWDVGVSGQTVLFITAHGGPWSGACRVNRGFVESVSCGGNWWVNHGDALAAHQPVRSVSVHGRPSDGWSVPVDPDDQSTEADFVVAGRRVTVPRGKGPRPLFEARWPGITFDLPWATWLDANTTGDPVMTAGFSRAADSIRRATDEAAREEADDLDAVVRELAARYGIDANDPEPAAAMSRIEIAGDRPWHRVVCGCESRVHLFEIRDDRGPASPVPSRTVDLVPLTFVRNGRRLLVYHGRCGGCNRIYFGVSRLDRTRSNVTISEPTSPQTAPID